MEEMVLVKKVDKQGRVVLPREWRKRLESGRVLLIIRDDTIILKPYKSDLTKFFDKIEVDLRSDLYDWKSVRRELLEAD